MAATAYEAGEEIDEEVEEEEDEDEESGLDLSYCWSNWWVDRYVAFDLGLSDECSEDDKDKWLRYIRVVSESEGFLVEPKNNPHGASLAVYPLPLDKVLYWDYTEYTVGQMGKEVATVVLERYNRENGSNVKFESVVRVNYRFVVEIYLYITFMAAESADGDLVEYQTKACNVIGRDEYFPIFCRPAPKPHGMILNPMWHVGFSVPGCG